MQYKRWVARHRIVIPEEESQGIFSETDDDEMDYAAEDEFVEGEEEEEDHQEAETLTPSIKWPVRQRKGWPQRADKAELTLNMPGFHSALKRYIQSRPASGVDGGPGRRTEENPLVWVYNCITVRYPAWSRDELGGDSSVGNVEH